jgi:hypothetical protein
MVSTKSHAQCFFTREEIGLLIGANFRVLAQANFGSFKNEHG